MKYCYYRNGQLIKITNNPEDLKNLEKTPIQHKENYVNGKREGYWEEYYYNGKLRCKGNYVNGKRRKRLGILSL